MKIGSFLNLCDRRLESSQNKFLIASPKLLLKLLLDFQFSMIFL